MIICNNHLGQSVSVPKEKFHFRPSVYGIIRNNDKICVCKLKSSGKLWFPGGGVEIGEKLMDALLREIKEETGLVNIQVIRLLGFLENFYYHTPSDEAMHAFLFFYECVSEETKMCPNKDIVPADEDACDFVWMEISKISAGDLNDLNDEVFKIISNL